MRLVTPYIDILRVFESGNTLYYGHFNNALEWDITLEIINEYDLNDQIEPILHTNPTASHIGLTRRYDLSDFYHLIHLKHRHLA